MRGLFRPIDLVRASMYRRGFITVFHTLLYVDDKGEDCIGAIIGREYKAAAKCTVVREKEHYF